MKTIVVLASLSLVLFATSKRAVAEPKLGADFGIAQRTVQWVEPILTAPAFGAHAETDLAPIVSIGSYYLHYELPRSLDRVYYYPEGTAYFESGVHNVVGIHVRATLPDSGLFKPYVFVGAGYTWVTHHLGTMRSFSGHFVELPAGVGLAYEVAQKWAVSFEAAYRPAVLFGGFLYEDDGHKSYTGTSFLLGASFAL